MTEPTKEPIDPTLFEYISEEVDRLRKDSSAIEETLSSDSPIIFFCENFFLQFFENVIQYSITGVDAENKERAARARRRLPAGPTRMLIAQFERLCEVYPDVFGSGPSEHDVRDFHEQYIPRLLNRIVDWAEQAPNQAILSPANNALASYQEVLDMLGK
jgi:hypothetical protein